MKYPQVLRNIIDSDEGQHYKNVVPRPLPEYFHDMPEDKLKEVLKGLLIQKETEKIYRKRITRIRLKDKKASTSNNPDNVETLTKFHATVPAKKRGTVDLPALGSQTPSDCAGSLLWIAYFSDRKKQNTFYVHGFASNAFDDNKTIRSIFNKGLQDGAQNFTGKPLYVLPGNTRFLVRHFPRTQNGKPISLYAPDTIQPQVLDFPSGSKIEAVAEMGKVVAVCVLSNAGKLVVLTFNPTFRPFEDELANTSARIVNRNPKIRGVAFCFLRQNPEWATFKARFTQYGIAG